MLITDDYVADRINGWDFRYDPWEHCVDEQFFPDEYYNELREAVELTNTGSKGSPPSRKNQDIIDVKESTDCPKFWNNWFEVFESQKVQTALIQKFGIEGFSGFNNIRTDIHKCESGFYLEHHNDTKYDIHNAYIVGFQFYIPVDNQDREDEGCFLTLGEGKPEVLIPYKQNLAWSFNSTPDSYHHVPKCTDTRHSVIMKYCIIDTETAAQLANK